MTTLRSKTMRAVVFLCVGLLPGAGTALTLDAVDSGAYLASGTHNPTNENYLTGQFQGNQQQGIEHRSFFVFDLASVGGTITSATLRLFNPLVSATLTGYVSPDPTETLNIYDVGTSAADITGGTAGVGGFNDLGGGTLYGTRVVSAADNGTVVEIALNAAAVADLNSATGLFLLGGALGTIAGGADQYVFGFSMASFVSDQTRQLVLTVASIPEPSSAALLACVAAIMLAFRGRSIFRHRRALDRSR